MLRLRQCQLYATFDSHQPVAPYQLHHKKSCTLVLMLSSSISLGETIGHDIIYNSQKTLGSSHASSQSIQSDGMDGAGTSADCNNSAMNVDINDTAIGLDVDGENESDDDGETDDR
ncbi:uncharacterized protein LOC100824753 [Brachypodium distachyon]|uniref:Uncharacterized protein n=1 Tax=Brachypodium distachyon TaxID=15368 RepID=A0A0Q3NJV5_BRADI|nr:uncharacterized protein LOC100824753 [Brachypodium distachyon]KQK17677.1 hypothetical protein BRADI_1g36038v3 [Brachypodium distachyon]|eukprot:XP_024312293.1 uncharacterized protein LOC100824753 [Brachypodium distachyon]